MSETEKEKRDRWWRYLYYDKDWKHMIAIKKTLLKDGLMTDESERFAKIVNYTNRDNVRWIRI